MDGERWRKIDTIFQLVAAHPPAERAEFLAAQCSSDAALRREVESLLEAKTKAQRFFCTSKMPQGMATPVASVPKS